MKILLPLIILVISQLCFAQAPDCYIIFQGSKMKKTHIQLYVDDELIADSVIAQPTDSLNIVASFKVDSIPQKIVLKYGIFRKIEITDFSFLDWRIDSGRPEYSSDSIKYIVFKPNTLQGLRHRKLFYSNNLSQINIRCRRRIFSRKYRVLARRI